MDPDHPEWLTLDFLNQCIHSKERFREMAVTSFTSASAVPPGNNYGSYVLRVTAKLQDADAREQSLSLIIKCPLTGGTIKEFFENIYDTEPLFYKEFLQQGYQLLNRPFTAEYFPSPITSVVVLEDLKEKGFVMAEKVKQLDFEHCRLYMIAAANFHAMSFAVHKLDPELINRMGKEKVFSNDLDKALIDTNKNMIRYCFESFADRVEEFLEDDRIPRLVRECSTRFWDMLVKPLMPHEIFNTLNQGDPWLTNMMFKRDSEGRAYDIKLIDFQCPRYASPFSDLVFFIWSSANYDVLQDKQDALYEIYLDTFNSALEEMKCDERLTMDTVREHKAQQIPTALWMVILGRPMLMMSGFVDMNAVYTVCKEEYAPERNPYEVLYTESYCKEHLPALVKHLEHSGAFEFIEATLGKCDS